MEMRILEDTKDKLFVEIEHSPAIALNIVKSELWNDSHVKIVGTHKEHPLLDREKMVVETDGHAPRKSIDSAIKNIKKDFSKAAESLKGLR